MSPARNITPRVPGRSGRSERAFSIVELIVALIVVTVVVTGGAAAVMSSSSSETQLRAVSDTHAIARRAIERLRVDLSAQEDCNNAAAGTGMTTGWSTSSNSGAAASTTTYEDCTYKYDDMRDAQRRLYHVTATIKPVDDASDGTGSTDADEDRRDRYDVSVKVVADKSSLTDGEKIEDVTVRGSIDWNAASGGSARLDSGYIRVTACAMSMPVRAVVAGVCETGDASRTPLASQTKIFNEHGDHVGTITSQGGYVPLLPGAYRLEPSADTFTDGGTGVVYDHFDLSPTELVVVGGKSYDVFATYVPQPKPVEICTQVTNIDEVEYPRGDIWKIHDYEIRATNFYYRRHDAPGYDWTRLQISKDFNNSLKGWNCKGQIDAHSLHDPMTRNARTNDVGLYEGVYDFQIEEEMPTATPVGLDVRSVTTNCNVLGTDWNSPTDGGSAIIKAGNGTPDPLDANLDPVESYNGTAKLGGNVQRLCIRFESMTKRFEDCPASEHASSPNTCVFYKCTMSVPGEPVTVHYADPSYSCTPQQRTFDCYVDAGLTQDADCGAGFDQTVSCTKKAIPWDIAPFVLHSDQNRPCLEGTWWDRCELAKSGGVHLRDMVGNCWDETQACTYAWGGLAPYAPWLQDPDGIACSGDEYIRRCARQDGNTTYPDYKPLEPDGTCAPSGGGGAGSLPPATPVTQYDGSGHLGEAPGAANYQHQPGSYNPAWMQFLAAPANDHFATMGVPGWRSPDGQNYFLGWSAGGGIDDTSPVRCHLDPPHGGTGEYDGSGNPGTIYKSPSGAQVRSAIDNDRYEFAIGNAPYGPWSAEAVRNLTSSPTPRFNCDEVTFSAGWNVVNTFGMRACLEVYLQNRPGIVIRGRLMDEASGWGSSGNINIHVGAMKALIPEGAADPASVLHTQNRVLPYGGQTDAYDYVSVGTPYEGDGTSVGLLTGGGAHGGSVDHGGYMAVVREVDGDPNCSSAGTSSSPYAPENIAVSAGPPSDVPSTKTVHSLPSTITFQENPVYTYKRTIDNPAYEPPPDGSPSPFFADESIGL